MAYTSKQAAQEAQHNEASANKIAAPMFVDQRASTGVQLKQQQLMHAAQTPLQRMGAEEEEPLQGKFVAQRAAEEELLQGKVATAQLAEDEELLQGKFATAQLAGMEEEEPIQGKFETAQLAEEDELLQGKFSTSATAQLEEKPNNTGLPNQLKAGIESLSGMSMDHVKVHYNSSQPAQLNAHAYAQGSEIHVAPGQEQHLPHEAWHVVQQAQGRVKPTMQMKAGVPVNDDVGLETEADVMGAKALQQKEIPTAQLLGYTSSAIPIIQGLFLPDQRRDVADDYGTMVREYYKASAKNRQNDIAAIINAPVVKAIKPPALIGEGWTPESELAMEAGLYGMAYESTAKLVKGKPYKRIAMKLLDKTDMYFVEDFVATYTKGANPAVSLAYLKKLKDKNLLDIAKLVYREDSLGRNGMIYYFKLLNEFDLGEWHVHWEAGKKAGSPGWKKGKNGDKTPTGDEMKPLLGNLWGGD